MKNYLNYQSSEYDCGSVSITNGIRYLFDREEISPDNGHISRSGTTLS